MHPRLRKLLRLPARLQTEKAAVLARSDFSITHGDYLELGAGTYVNKFVSMVTPTHPNSEHTKIEIGNQCHIGRHCEFFVAPGNRISIGDFSSMNSGNVLIGDVHIGRYCTLAYNIYLSSGKHHFAVRPNWLLKDQDSLVQEGRAPGAVASAPVRLDEDVWVGWGVFIGSGVHIGRGAVIGANAVVLKDVPPYSIVGGVPSRELKKRLEFSPPQLLTAGDDACLPYFYEGFLCRQEDLARSRKDGLILAQQRVKIILPRAEVAKFFIRGALLGGRSTHSWSATLNNQPLGNFSVSGREFELVLSASPDALASAAAGILAPYHVLELQTAATSEPATDISRESFGISAVSTQKM